MFSQTFVCPGGSLSGMSLSRGFCLGESLSRGSLSRGLCPVSLCPGGLCPGGLCLGGLCPEGVSVRRSLPGDLCRGVSVSGVSLRGLCPRGSLSRDLCPGGLCHVDSPYGYVRVVRMLLECILDVNRSLSQHVVGNLLFYRYFALTK